MPRLVDVVIAPPAHRVEQATAADFARDTFGGAFKDITRLLPLFTNAGISSRHFCVPPEWFRAEHSLAEKNGAFIEAATSLCTRAGKEILERNKLKPSDIDRILFINTTGLATPSIDARLINLLGLRHDVRRTPIWGLGCAGGAAGLSHAFHHLKGRPKDRVLLFAAEMCSLTFLRNDTSKSNLVATALFSDGAAVALLTGDETEHSGFELLDARSTFYPDSLDVMGGTSSTPDCRSSSTAASPRSSKPTPRRSSTRSSPSTGSIAPRSPSSSFTPAGRRCSRPTRRRTSAP